MWLLLHQYQHQLKHTCPVFVGQKTNSLLFMDYLYSLNKLRRQARRSAILEKEIGIETEPARETADYGQLFRKSGY